MTDRRGVGTEFPRLAADPRFTFRARVPQGMDRTVVVTGADSEPGGAIARAIADHGGILVLGGQDSEELSSVRSDLAQLESSVLTRRADARDEFDLEWLLETASREAGPIDVVIPAQVASHDPEGAKPLSRVSYSAFDDVLRATLRGAFSTIREATPHLAPDGTVLVPVPAIDSLQSGSRPLSIAAAGQRGLISAAATDLDRPVLGVEYEPSVAGNGEGEPLSIGEAALAALERADALDGTVASVETLLEEG